MFSRQAARITATIGVLSAATITVVVLSGQVPATSGVTTTLSPVADGYVQDNTPSTNYGASTRFVVGNSPVRDTYGVLKLTLHANSYDWQFVPEAGKTYSDSGTTNCH
ncbi:MAG: hypothetical protein M3186_03365 [Actinomycetota bacterium]|nr:hypothetical protein [Actinomycetota bacterium]